VIGVVAAPGVLIQLGGLGRMHGLRGMHGTARRTLGQRGRVLRDPQFVDHGLHDAGGSLGRLRLNWFVFFGMFHWGLLYQEF
jgi:hypothetical protein